MVGPVSSVLGGAIDAPPGTTPAHAAPPRRRRKRDLTPLWLLSPAGLVLAAVTLAPIGFLVYTSFTDYNQRSMFTGLYSKVGLQQYSDLLSSSDFWAALVRTVLFTAAMVAGSVVVGMGVSHLLTRVGKRWRWAVTVVLITAWAMPNVASSEVWKWLFEPGYGVVNWAIGQLRIFGDTSSLDWTQNPTRAYAAVWMLIVWQAVPFIALTLNAAETQVPVEYLEAARLDGATESAIYRMITLRWVRPTLLLVTILSVIWDFNVFNQAWLFSGTTLNTLGVYTYRTAFVGFLVGKGAAISVVTTLLLLAMTAVYIRRLLKSGEDL